MSACTQQPDANPHVVVVTTEPLPLPGRPASGAGLRAWGLAQGLRAAGLRVTLMMPADAAATFAGAADQSQAAATSQDHPPVVTFERSALPQALAQARPDVVVLQHWGLANRLGELDCPLAIDLAGPHLLERRLWGSPDPGADLSEKLDALRRADFVTTSGRRQRDYFLAFLAMAGWPVDRGGLAPVIPFSMDPPAQPAPVRPERLIYGGFFLPWQDPAWGLEVALDTMDRLGRGELLFVGGAHPGGDVSRGRFEALTERLRQHPRVKMLGPMPCDAYRALLAEGGVALDLMAPNVERELAYTTRTVVYLAAGLPVIHDNYSELGEVIAGAGAGWAVEPGNRPALEALLENILTGRLELDSYARAAASLVQGPLNWGETIGPLAEFCRHPALREGKVSARLAFEERDRALASTRQELEQVRVRLNTLLGKRWVRWGLSLTQGRAWLRPLAALAAALTGAALIPVFLLNDCMARSARAETLRGRQDV